MKRRLFVRHFAALVGIGAAGQLTGCGRKKEAAQTAPQNTPEPEPTETPLAEPTPEPSVTVAEIEPTPDASADEPQAPYGELTANQQTCLDAVMESLADVNANETKRWAENVAFDETGREHELRVWERIAQGYTRYLAERPGINDAAKAEAFNVLLTASLVPVNDLLRYVKLAALSPDDAKAVAALYVAPDATASPEP